LNDKIYTQGKEDLPPTKKVFDNEQGK